MCFQEAANRKERLIEYNQRGVSEFQVTIEGYLLNLYYENIFSSFMALTALKFVIPFLETGTETFIL